MASTVYNRGKFLIADTFVTQTTGLTLMLVTTGYVYNNDHNTVDDGTTDDPKSYEISVGNYARQALASDSSFEDDTNDFAGLDHANVTFSALATGATIGGGVLYRYSTAATTSDTGQNLVSFYALAATPTNGGDIVVAVAATSDGALIKFGSTS